MISWSRTKRFTTLIGSATLACGAALSAPQGSPGDASSDAPFRTQIDSQMKNFKPQNHGKRHHDPGRDEDDRSRDTRTPIKHVILIIGENRTFDHVFATYQPPRGETVSNLLSKGIVNLDGTPGPHAALARQWQAQTDGTFDPSPTKTQPYATLPDINTDGAPTNPPAASAAQARAIEPALPDDAYEELANGGTGLPRKSVDTRFPSNLPNAPIDMSRSIAYDDYASSPVHRFFQMWQQLDCDAKAANPRNLSGCQNDLFPWVEVTVGAGSNGAAQPANFTDQTTGEGSTAMQFYNVAKGDVPYFAQLAREYTMSDNFHQSIMGGTGANHIMLGYGSLIYYADANGQPATPPAEQIENPNPQPGTNNWYTQDGYSGGTYTNCSDTSQPGVTPIVNYLSSLKSKPSPNCAPNTYYLLNNYAPGYFGDGSANPGTFVIPPSSLRTIGDELLERNISWRYYGEGWNLYVQDPNYTNPYNAYCDICNPFQYSTAIMTNAAVRQNNLKDINDLYNDIGNGTLPAVSFVKPDGFLDGHPTNSKFDLFEAFVQKIVLAVQAKPQVWDSTAIVITVDEGGGYWDSGYIQPLDFFGDGPRIPLIAVSPFSRGGHISHTYSDHVSILKFIERNWNLRPLTRRSRDNLPNPRSDRDDPYVPKNSPAIGDLFDLFDFGHEDDQ